MNIGKETQAKEKLNIRMVLDRSGSMSSCRNETVDSINKYVEEIKKDGVVGLFTLSTFDSVSIDIPISRVKINELIEFGYDILEPRGGTPLNDAIGLAVSDLSNFNLEGNEKKVLVIVTDGMENASREYSTKAIKQLIEEKTKEGWLIIYLGADHDAFLQSSNLGFEVDKTLHYAKRDSVDAFRTVATKTTQYSRGMKYDEIGFIDEERKNSNKDLYKKDEE